MSKYIFVGDTHGFPIARHLTRLLESEKNIDEIIITGDYLDSYTYTNREILNNFEELLNFAKDPSTPFTRLLIGNHCVQYFLWHTPMFRPVRCTGYRSTYLYKVYNLYKQTQKSHPKIFDIIWDKKNLLVTHAGITNSWYNNLVNKPQDATPPKVIRYFWHSLDPQLFEVAKGRRGDDKHSGPLWADYPEISEDPISGYIQIVGHNPVSAMHTINGVTFINTIQNREEFEYYKLEMDE